MASFGKALGDSLKRLFFRELTVERVLRVSEHFERIDFESEALREARFAPGDKLQISFDGGPRTYTPFGFDAERGTLSVLVYLHGDGPSARWANAVAAGDQVFAFGPRSSLTLTPDPRPIALFGDETSFALARALRESRGAASSLGLVFEVTNSSECRAVLAGLELTNAELVERRENEQHLSDVETRLRSLLAQDPTTRLVLTGSAPSIQALQKRLKAQPVPHADQSVKAYWALGKRGLD